MPAKVGVRPPGDGAQKLADRGRREFAPLDAELVFVYARHVGLDDRRLVLRPQRQDDGNLDAGEHPCFEVRLDQRAADAQIGEPAISHRVSMRHHSDREINLYPLAPPMFHDAIISRTAASPHRTNTEMPCDISDRCRAKQTRRNVKAFMHPLAAAGRNH